jgi:hypothetical protein
MTEVAGARRRRDRVSSRRQFFCLLGSAAAAWPVVARRQQVQNRCSRIGWLQFGGATPGVIDRTLRDALSGRGLVDGHKIEVIVRHANGKSERLLELANELVTERPSLLIGIGGDVVGALLSVSGGRIPVLGGVTDDPCAPNKPYLSPARHRLPVVPRGASLSTPMPAVLTKHRSEE